MRKLNFSLIFNDKVSLYTEKNELFNENNFWSYGRKIKV